MKEKRENNVNITRVETKMANELTSSEKDENIKIIAGKEIMKEMLKTTKRLKERQ